MCRGQYHGWLKEKVGSHIVRRCNIHHCEQGGIIGRMGGVFSLIEDNHIHHINNMMELGARRLPASRCTPPSTWYTAATHIHHCTMGIWCDWGGPGYPHHPEPVPRQPAAAFAKQLKGGMMSQDIFVEVGHGPTLIDNNILLSEASADGHGKVHTVHKLDLRRPDLRGAAAPAPVHPITSPTGQR